MELQELFRVVVYKTNHICRMIHINMYEWCSHVSHHWQSSYPNLNYSCHWEWVLNWIICTFFLMISLYKHISHSDATINVLKAKEFNILFLAIFFCKSFIQFLFFIFLRQLPQYVYTSVIMSLQTYI